MKKSIVGLLAVLSVVALVFSCSEPVEQVKQDIEPAAPIVKDSWTFPVGTQFEQDGNQLHYTLPAGYKLYGVNAQTFEVVESTGGTLTCECASADGPCLPFYVMAGGQVVSSGCSNRQGKEVCTRCLGSMSTTPADPKPGGEEPAPGSGTEPGGSTGGTEPGGSGGDDTQDGSVDGRIPLLHQYIMKEQPKVGIAPNLRFAPDHVALVSSYDEIIYLTAMTSEQLNNPELMAKVEALKNNLKGRAISISKTDDGKMYHPVNVGGHLAYIESEIFDGQTTFAFADEQDPEKPDQGPCRGDCTVDGKKKYCMPDQRGPVTICINCNTGCSIVIPVPTPKPGGGEPGGGEPGGGEPGGGTPPDTTSTGGGGTDDGGI